MKGEFSINGKRIGSGSRTYIVAEMSANHHQDLNEAFRLVDAAKRAGADAIKTQAYLPESITLPFKNKHLDILKGTIWEGKTLFELYSEAYTFREWHSQIQRRAAELGLDFFSTAFSAEDVEFLEKLKVPIHKIASFEIVDIPLIEKAASTGKPLIISTGMASIEDVEEAVEAARAAGAKQLALLKCTSAYPAPPEEMNLMTIQDMSKRFSLPVGLSDHTLGISVPVTAVTLGACIIEKHLTISRANGGPDSKFSLEPSEFNEMTNAIRTCEKAIGKVSYDVSEAEKRNRVFRRSLFIVEDVKKGERLTPINVRSIRPSFGLPPREYANILGKRAKRDITAGTPLDWSLIESSD